jgi:hypothetical protein
VTGAVAGRIRSDQIGSSVAASAGGKSSPDNWYEKRGRRHELLDTTGAPIAPVVFGKGR